jgi:YD repeat-containing protein
VLRSIRELEHDRKQGERRDCQGLLANGGLRATTGGWSIAGLDRLYVDSTGVLRIYGSGGTRYFTGTGPSYTSPANDFGTLVKNGDGSFTYTAKDQTKWNFTSAGLLSSVVDAHGLAVTYTYSSGLLSTVQEPDGGLATFAYSSGLLSTITEPGNRVVTLVHDGNSNVTGITAPDGSLRTLAYDGGHRLVNDQWSPLNVTYAYDATSGVLSSIDRGGGSIETLSPRLVQGLATSPANSASQALAVFTDALGQATTYTLDALGRDTVLQTPDGASQLYTLNSAGLVTVYTDALNRATTYAYSAAGDLTGVQYPDGSLATFSYDATFHHITQAQDTRGDLTTFGYNATGDLTTTRDALNEVTTLAWSGGLLQSVTDPLGHVTSYQYDSARRLLVETNAVGGLATYSYDSAGNVRTVQDALGRVTTFTSDGMRRLVSQTNALGGVVSLAYNAIGEVTSRTDELGRVSNFSYDGHGWLTVLTEAAGTPVQRATTMGYDVLGRKVSQTDADGHTLSYSYDQVGRVRTVTNALREKGDVLRKNHVSQRVPCKSVPAVLSANLDTWTAARASGAALLVGDDERRTSGGGTRVPPVAKVRVVRAIGLDSFIAPAGWALPSAHGPRTIKEQGRPRPVRGTHRWIAVAFVPVSP